MKSKLKHASIPIPETMEHLPRTDLGYIKPWFVKDDDFRVVDVRKAAFAVTKKACWICGKPFATSHYAMVCSPMSASARVFKEPPCHTECAEYALQVCPFLLLPKAKRRTANLPEESQLEKVNESLEVKIGAENPGEYYLVEVSDFVFHQDKQVMTCELDNVLNRQYWREGTRLNSNPSQPDHSAIQEQLDAG